jgi:hypothetical protein
MSEQPGLKVLFLTSSYPHSHEDTASVFLCYIAEHLADRGLKIHVLGPADTNSGTAVEGKVTVHRFRYFPRPLQRLRLRVWNYAESAPLTVALASSSVFRRGDGVFAAAHNSA